jgi:hypothetical protein
MRRAFGVGLTALLAVSAFSAGAAPDDTDVAYSLYNRVMKLETSHQTGGRQGNLGDKINEGLCLEYIAASIDRISGNLLAAYQTMSLADMASDKMHEQMARTLVEIDMKLLAVYGDDLRSEVRAARKECPDSAMVERYAEQAAPIADETLALTNRSLARGGGLP